MRRRLDKHLILAEEDGAVGLVGLTHSPAQLGEVLDRNLMPAGPFAVSADSLNRHVFVCGATGAR